MRQVITDVGIVQNAQARLVRTMPSIPRGNGKLTDSLLTILDMVQADTPLNTTVKLEGSSSEATLNDCCVSLHATRIVQKKRKADTKFPRSWSNGSHLEITLFWLDYSRIVASSLAACS